MSNPNLGGQDLYILGVPTLQSQDWGPVQRFFLQRLWRLLNMQKQISKEISSEGIMMIRRAIYSTYLDCVAAGASAEASRFIREVTGEAAVVPNHRQEPGEEAQAAQ